MEFLSSVLVSTKACDELTNPAISDLLDGVLDSSKRSSIEFNHASA